MEEILIDSEEALLGSERSADASDDEESSAQVGALSARVLSPTSTDHSESLSSSTSTSSNIPSGKLKFKQSNNI